MTSFNPLYPCPHPSIYTVIEGGKKTCVYCNWLAATEAVNDAKERLDRLTKIAEDLRKSEESSDETD